jgi:co-chaperonin GroES (HSP10)
MSNVGVHSFQIPHEHVRPTRDMVIVRIPLPPSKIGSILTPDITRDMMQHNVMAGRIVAMGPLAFQYRKGEDSFEAHDVKIGDWVLFRPFAGTMIQGGQLMATNGYRYVSSFNDVIGIISAETWNPTCEWEYKGDEAAPPAFGFHNVKEKVA